jgi:predicted PurR-regulated permease PerM
MKMEDLNHIIKKTNNMEYLLVFGIMFIVVAIVSWRWVEGIDYMSKNYPDYKGEDFLDWGNETAPWKDDNKDNNKTIEKAKI